MGDLIDIYRRIEASDLPKAQILEMLKGHLNGDNGITLSYSGRKEPWQITKLVKPKVTKIIKAASIGSDDEQAKNMIIEGENLSAMTTLYKYRGQVDLVVTDPPYNADRDFRYNDKWDTNPDDPDLGNLVLADDGSKHSKWLRFMAPRLYMMKEMLKPHGVIAICIDHRELYRLGILMDEIFGEKNRIGIINWQKSYSPKSHSTHISTATEYVLVYAKDIDRAKTGLEARTEAMDGRFWNPDNDKDGLWKINSDASAKESSAAGTYGIQSPFNGEIYYPRGKTGHWAFGKSDIKKWLEGWGSEYEERDICDNVIFSDKKGKEIRVKALVLKGCKFKDGKAIGSKEILEQASESAKKVLVRGQWPKIHFGQYGTTAPQIKRYLADTKQGKVSLSWWANEDYDTPLEISCASWAHAESGHSQSGINELDAVVGKGHNFETVKPLKLIKKIIHLWCRPDGLVLDPFAGSGTTGQAVLELNQEAKTDRRFILMEQGNAGKDDHYAKTLTADRVRRVITGDWKAGKRDPVPGGFRYIQLQTKRVDAEAVKALAREEMIDLLTTSYWNASERSKSFLTRMESNGFLFAKNARNEGFFLIWTPSGVSALTRDTYSEIMREAKKLDLAARFHVYASSAPYVAQNVEFYKIPDKVLEHLGFNATNDAYVDGE